MYRAKVSFSGLISMSVGDEAEIADASIAKDLLRAGYIELVQPARKEETAKKETAKKKPTKARTKRG